MNIIFVGLCSYVFGSIPYGLILIKIFNKKDIRKIGSGNIGATNVLRSGNKLLAFLISLLLLPFLLLIISLNSKYASSKLYICSRK